MAASQRQVGPQIAPDGSLVNAAGDRYGATLIQNLGGIYAELARRNQLFMFSTPTAAALLVSATTGNCPTIWNPPASGKIFYPLRLAITWLTGATTVGSVLWTVTEDTGATIATASRILTWTDGTIKNAMVGGTAISSMRFAPAVCTFTTAPAFLASTGINIETTNQVHNVNEDYPGCIGIMPGNAISLNYSVATSTSTHYVTIWGAEVPI